MAAFHECEEIERAGLEALHRVATPELRESLRLQDLTLGPAFASVAAALPDSAIVINRAVGFGLREASTEAQVDAMLKAYQTAHVGRFFVQLAPDAENRADLDRWLMDRGLIQARAWQKFVLTIGDETKAPERASTLTVREISADEPEVCRRVSEILCDAFDLGEAAYPWLARLPEADKWHVLASFEGEEPAGTGSIYIDGEAGWLDFGATAPAFRQRGSQSALLRARIALAAEKGVRRLYTCTGVDVPGDPQHSYSNIQRAGFIEDYVRDNFSPPRIAE